MTARANAYYERFKWAVALRKQRGLSLGAFAVLAVLVGYADKTTGDCWPTRERIAQDLGTSLSTVKRGLTELKKRQVIAVTRDKRRNNQYRLLDWATPAQRIAAAPETASTKPDPAPVNGPDGSPTLSPSGSSGGPQGDQRPTSDGVNLEPPTNPTPSQETHPRTEPRTEPGTDPGPPLATHGPANLDADTPKEFHPDADNELIQAKHILTKLAAVDPERYAEGNQVEEEDLHLDLFLHAEEEYGNLQLLLRNLDVVMDTGLRKVIIPRLTL